MNPFLERALFHLSTISLEGGRVIRTTCIVARRAGSNGEASVSQGAWWLRPAESSPQTWKSIKAITMHISIRNATGSGTKVIEKNVTAGRTMIRVARDQQLEVVDEATGRAPAQLRVRRDGPLP